MNGMVLCVRFIGNGMGSGNPCRLWVWVLAGMGTGYNSPTHQLLNESKMLKQDAGRL